MKKKKNVINLFVIITIIALISKNLIYIFLLKMGLFEIRDISWIIVIAELILRGNAYIFITVFYLRKKEKR